MHSCSVCINMRIRRHSRSKSDRRVKRLRAALAFARIALRCATDPMRNSPSQPSLLSTGAMRSDAPGGIHGNVRLQAPWITLGEHTRPFSGYQPYGGSDLGYPHISSSPSAHHGDIKYAMAVDFNEEQRRRICRGGSRKGEEPKAMPARSRGMPASASKNVLKGTSGASAFAQRLTSWSLGPAVLSTTPLGHAL